MTGPKVQGRPSIRKEITTSVNSSNNRSDLSDIDDEDPNEFSYANETQYSHEESLKEQSSQSLVELLKERNESCINERTSSPIPRRRREQSKFSYKYDKNNSRTLESPIIGQQTNSSNSVLIIVIVVVVGVAVLLWYSQKGVHRVCSFHELKKKYPNEDEKMWNYLKYGNEHILNNEGDKPAVFLFISYGKGIADKLVGDIAQTSANCYGTPRAKTVEFNTKEAIEDYGHVIESYKSKVKEGNVILIANLNEIHGEAAKALHAICDTITPLVKKVIILLKMTVKKPNEEEKLVETAENELKKLWQDNMEPYELLPIITRVTDQVFLLKSN